jgi:hypothetical protein
VNLLSKCGVLCGIAFLCLAVSDRVNGEEERPIATWKSFRQEFPFHVQTIALSEPSQTDGRTLIVSEPPPGTTLKDVKEAAPRAMANAVIMQHPIGVDGWVRDVVGVVPPGTDSRVLYGEIASLSSRLFGTAYKAYALPFPAKGAASKKLNLDVQIGANELNDWLNDNAMFRTAGSSARISPKEIYAAKTTGVYYGFSRGLVVWWVPKGTRLSQSRAVIRQFAIDSDLLVGGIINDQGVLVVARERSTPLGVVLPLRAETLVLLANVSEDELAQSYERHYPLAGRFDGEHDWAPILLSAQLRHTEFGSLLNITDQLLKGWSTAGNTEYSNFPYPKPARFPFAAWNKPGKARSLYFLLNERIQDKTGDSFESLVFNWNTVGAGYSIHYPQGEVCAMNRTGALPVTYLPDGADMDSDVGSIVADAMEMGYAYYATLDDPNLARVMQYASFYQLFRAAQAAGAWTPNDAVKFQTQPETELRRLFVGALAQIRNEPEKIVARISTQAEHPDPKTTAAVVRDLNETVNRLRADLSKYSADSLQAALAEVETADDVDALLFRVMLTESDLAAQPGNKLPTLPDDASAAQRKQRALDRCADLSLRGDEFWKALETPPAKGKKGMAAGSAGPWWTELRQELKKIGLDSIKRFANDKPSDAAAAKRKDVARLRERLAGLKTLRELKPTPAGDGKQGLLELLKEPSTKDLILTYRWLSELTKEDHDKFTADATLATLRRRSDGLQESVRKYAASLRKWPAAAIEPTVALLDQAQSKLEKAAVVHALAAALGEEKREDFGELREIVVECGKLLREAQLLDFAATYSKAVKGQSADWIKTPSIVISQAISESEDLVGGHNVDAKITKFEVIPDVAPGEVKIIDRDGEKHIVIHPDDAAKIPAHVRLAAAKFKHIEEMERRGELTLERLEEIRGFKKQAVAELKAALAKFPRPKEKTQLEALKLTEGGNGADRGAVPPASSPGNVPALWESGYWCEFQSLPPEPVSSLHADLHAAGMAAILVSRRSDLSFDLISPAGERYRAGNFQAACDICAQLGAETKDGSVRIYTKELSEDEERALPVTLRLTVQRDVEHFRSNDGERFKDAVALTEKLDGKQAKMTTATTPSGVHADIEFPVVGGDGKARLSVEISTNRPTVAQRIKALFSKAFETFRRKGVFTLKAIVQFLSDLGQSARKLDPDAKVDFRFHDDHQHQLLDLSIGASPVPSPPDTSLAGR